MADRASPGWSVLIGLFDDDSVTLSVIGCHPYPPGDFERSFYRWILSKIGELPSVGVFAMYRARFDHDDELGLVADVHVFPGKDWPFQGARIVRSPDGDIAVSDMSGVEGFPSWVSDR